VTGRQRNAAAVATALEQRVTDIASIAAKATYRPRVLCLEWLERYYVGGHSVPAMVSFAGGEDVLGRLREPSFKITAEQIAQSRADVIVVMPCGYNAARTAVECDVSRFPESWHALPAVCDRRIFAVDANAYFSRPGPRLADGVALLAHLIHPKSIRIYFRRFPQDRFAHFEFRR
jgi:iron complex transport system substrate-binding protein